MKIKLLTTILALSFTSLSFADEKQSVDAVLKNPKKELSITYKDEDKKTTTQIQGLTSEDSLKEGNIYIINQQLTQLKKIPLTEIQQNTFESLNDSCKTTLTKFKLNDGNDYLLSYNQKSFFSFLCDNPTLHKETNVNNELNFDYYATITSKTRNFVVGKNTFIVNLVKDTKNINLDSINTYFVPIDRSDVLDTPSKARKNALGKEYVGEVTF